jgi:hypothetical protein
MAVGLIADTVRIRGRTVAPVGAVRQLVLERVANGVASPRLIYGRMAGRGSPVRWRVRRS